MNPTHLVSALNAIGTPVCLEAARTLEATTETTVGLSLHLRRAGLNHAEARVLADGLVRADAADGLFFLGSFSASYNPKLGDAGAAVLAAAFPETLTELGLVGCTIGDSGGRALLEWAQMAPNLKMICVEDNRFSKAMRSQFQGLSSKGRRLVVVV